MSARVRSSRNYRRRSSVRGVLRRYTLWLRPRAGIFWRRGSLIILRPDFGPGWDGPLLEHFALPNCIFVLGSATVAEACRGPACAPAGCFCRAAAGGSAVLRPAQLGAGVQWAAASACAFVWLAPRRVRRALSVYVRGEGIFPFLPWWNYSGLGFRPFLG